MNGRGFGTEKVLEGIAAAESAGFHPIKVNAVVQRGVNDHTIVDLARHFRERGHVMRFIEYMDVGNRNGWRMDHVVPADEIVARIDAEMPLEPVESGYRGEVALRYRYRDGGGEIGVIASVTKPFCGDCTRPAPVAGGQHLHLSVLQQGDRPARPAQGRRRRRQATVARRLGLGASAKDRYSEIRTSLTEPVRDKVEMYHIGG